MNAQQIAQIKRAEWDRQNQAAYDARLDPADVRTAWLDWQRHNMIDAAQIRSIFADEAVKNFQRAQQYLLRTIAEKIGATYAEVYAAIGQ